ncbi:MAG: peptidoglycan DD-metalloendopeptidase family protein [Thermoleophilia bacterium]
MLTALTSSAALAVDIPTSQPTSAAAPPPPATSSQQPAPAATTPVSTPATTGQTGATATPAATVIVLKTGSFGASVRDLQRELRRRGFRYIRVDGAFGPSTRRAVRTLQRRMHLAVTGIADQKLLKRLGIQVSTPAAANTPVSVGVAQPVIVSGAKYLKTFPVLGTYTYQDDFGAPRHQGAHEGNDIMSPRGSAVVAVADGTIKRMTRVETGLGGIWIWLQDTAGNEYYYAHLDSIAAGLQPGSAVKAGQVIGAVGNTGDARWGDTHLHFELHPGGGGAADPYSDLRAVDPHVAK